MKKNKVLSSCEKRIPRIKHAGLTKYLRRHSVATDSARVLKDILYRCDVSPYLGELPPELRVRVPRDILADVTYKFRQELEDFLIKNNYRFLTMVKSDVFYDLPQLGNLFNTPCVLEVRGTKAFGISPWQGGIGLVCKLSFPEINAHYALKTYSDDCLWTNFLGAHGPWFEISTALLASHTEPRDNNKVYMASLIYEKYMLSAWGGDVVDNIPKRENENEMFYTTQAEDVNRNRRLGRRIDWGETFKTSYGSLSYKSRKLYRQIMNYDIKAVKKSLDKIKNLNEKHEAKRGIALAMCIAQYDDNHHLMNFIKKINCYMR